MANKTKEVSQLLNEARNNIVDTIYKGEVNGILSSDELKSLENAQEIIELIVTRLVK